MNKPQIHRPAMAKYYFTYGKHPDQPFEGGWTLIYAPSMAAAQQLFKMYHPNPDGSGKLTCSCFYTHMEFVEDEMYRSGNYGVKCHEIICPRFPAGDMETLMERDKDLEELWMHYGELSIDPETKTTKEEFLHFPAGTRLEEIWKWFDQRYSKGVGCLLYEDGNARTLDLENLSYRKTLCEECGCTNCGFQADGFCKFALIHGEKPPYDEHHGCLGFTEKPEICWTMEHPDGV